jgi:hypothetical protein
MYRNQAWTPTDICMRTNNYMRTYNLYLFVRAFHGFTSFTLSQYIVSSLRRYAGNKAVAVDNLKQPVLPYHRSSACTESSSMGSQLYVKISPTSSIDNNKLIGQLRGMPLIRSPYHTPVLPLTPHRLLATLRCRSLLKTC